MSKTARLQYIIDELGEEEARRAVQISEVKFRLILSGEGPVGKSTGIRIDKEYNQLKKDKLNIVPDEPELEELNTNGQKRAGSKIYRSGTQQISDTYLW